MTATITPVKLRNSETGSWLRTWSNNADVLARDENDRVVSNPARLAANVYRAENSKHWTIRLFTHNSGLEGITVDVETLREVRLVLGWLAENFDPHLRAYESLNRAVAAVSAAESDRIRAELVEAGIW